MSHVRTSFISSSHEFLYPERSRYANSLIQALSNNRHDTAANTSAELDDAIRKFKSSNEVGISFDVECTTYLDS